MHLLRLHKPLYIYSIYCFQNLQSLYQCLQLLQKKDAHLNAVIFQSPLFYILYFSDGHLSGCGDLHNMLSFLDKSLIYIIS